MYVKIIRTLVSPTKSTENIFACQCKVKECGKKRIKRKKIFNEIDAG